MRQTLREWKNETGLTRTHVTLSSIWLGLMVLGFATGVLSGVTAASLSVAAVGLALLSWTVVHLRRLRILIENSPPSEPASSMLAGWRVGQESRELLARVGEGEELFEFLLKKAAAAAHARKGTVMLNRRDGLGLDVVASHGWNPNFVGPIAPDDTVAGPVLRSGEPLIGAGRSPFESRHDSTPTQEYASPSYLILPLKTPYQTVGVLCLSERVEGAFTETDMGALTILLDRAEYAVDAAIRLSSAENRVRDLEEEVLTLRSRVEDARSKILHNNRLAILGEIVTGVAHEITNPATSILGYAQLASEGENRPRELRRLKTIFHESRRVASIIRNLLHFAHEQRGVRRETDVNELVRTVVSLRQYELEVRGVDLSADLDPRLPPVVVDPAAVQQVMLHLIGNSVQAMGSSGERKIRVGTEYADGKLILWVSDTGRGIPLSVQDRVFEPFFTSRSESEHSGLGLSICREIAAEHGGEISLQSVEGRGARVTLVIPAVVPLREAAQIDCPAPPSVLSSTPGYATGYALSVDDDEGNARLVAQMLEDLGFRVELALSGPTARQRILNENFDLVVCDLRMPELDGRALFREVMQTKPRAIKRILFTSGDAENRDVQAFTRNNGVRLLAKPFLREDFNRAVRDVFPESPAAQWERNHRIPLES